MPCLSVVTPICHSNGSSSVHSTIMPPKFLRNRPSVGKDGSNSKPMSLPIAILQMPSAMPPTEVAHAETTFLSVISLATVSHMTMIFS